jgi:hypothetical protein
VGAVCVEALVRICAGGAQRWASLPRQLAPPGFETLGKKGLFGSD